MKSQNYLSQSGQALTTLLIIMFFGLTVAAAATTIVDSNNLASSDLVESTTALTIAESGVEDSYLKLLRNPSYVGGTLPVGDGTATIIISGTNPTIISSQGQLGSHLRTIEVSVGFNNGVMSINYWKEK